MTQAEAIELLTQRWKDQWFIQQPLLTSYAFDNEQFRGASPVWANINFRHGTSVEMSQGKPGTRRHKRPGTIVVQLFGDIDKGRQPLDLLVEDVRAVYGSKRLATPADPIWLFAATPVEGGRNGKTTNGLWWTLNVVIPFTYFALV